MHTGFKTSLEELKNCGYKTTEMDTHLENLGEILEKLKSGGSFLLQEYGRRIKEHKK